MLHIAPASVTSLIRNKRHVICFIWKGRRPIRGIL